MPDRPPETPPLPGRRDQLRHIGLGALVVVAALLALLNLDKVSVDLLFRSVEMPLLILILICLALGAGIDRLYARRTARRRGR
jgi:uncharacterized integral membrane protein